jgi:N-acetylglutamate synthase-like GNAT family acetyltransferase
MAPRFRPATANDRAAVLGLLSGYPGLEQAFEPGEFIVAVDGTDAGRRILACGRLRVHADGAVELASVATDKARHGAGLGSAVVQRLLASAAGPVYALALAPGFFARHGFAETPRGGLPASVKAKAEGMCASQPFVAMVRR